jgi:hypothetical protein
LLGLLLRDGWGHGPPVQHPGTPSLGLFPRRDECLERCGQARARSVGDVRGEPDHPHGSRGESGAGRRAGGAGETLPQVALVGYDRDLQAGVQQQLRVHARVAAGGAGRKVGEASAAQQVVVEGAWGRHDQGFPPHHVQRVAAGKRAGPRRGALRALLELTCQTFALRLKPEHLAGEATGPGEAREGGDIHAANPGAQLP